MWPFKNRKEAKSAPDSPQDDQDEAQEDSAAWVDEIEEFMAIFED